MRLRWLRVFGPGLIAGASDDDPSGIATYSEAGARFGFALGWALIAAYPLTCAIQEIGARIGRTSGLGIAANIRRHYPGWIAHAVMVLLLLANTFNIGADLGAMGESLALLVGGPGVLYAAAFGVLTAALQIFLEAERYFSVLKWLTLSLLGYVAAFAVIVHAPGPLPRGLLLPRLSPDARFWATLLAVLGTTISPYVFLWQSSQEAADTSRSPERRPLKHEPAQAPRALGRIRLDTYVGMAIANFVALAIMASAAVALRQAHIYAVDTSIQAAEALRPIAGRFAATLFAIGILSTGLLSVPTLASSAAYAIAETRRWPRGLARLPREAKRFYATIAAATLLGVVLNVSPVTPIQALYLSAAINGLIAAPVMVLMMRLSHDPKVMGPVRVEGLLRALGWLATVVMMATAAGVIASLLSSLLGARWGLLP
jgi:NRAMP (natural resistance-associated macrophage protein)-like metal ion transporter